MIFFSWPLLTVLLCLPLLWISHPRSRLLITAQTSLNDGLRTAARVMGNIALLLLSIMSLRASGALAGFAETIQQTLTVWHINPELIPLIVMRPFSGSASAGLFAALAHQYGGNAAITLCAATFMGSSETTLYVISTYFAAVGIKRTRYAIPLGLATECVGILLALLLFPTA